MQPDLCCLLGKREDEETVVTQHISKLLHKVAATANVLCFRSLSHPWTLCVMQVILAKRSLACSRARTMNLFWTESPMAAAASSSFKTHPGANLV